MRRFFYRIISVFILITVFLALVMFPIHATETITDCPCSLSTYERIEYTPEYPSDSIAPRLLLPEKYDPRTINSTTPIKDQGQIPSCGIFASIACLEISAYKETGLKYIYSEEAPRFILSNRLRKINAISEDVEDHGFYNINTLGLWGFSDVSAYFTCRNEAIIEGNTIDWLAPNLSVDVPYTNINHEEHYGVLEDDYWPSNINSSYANVYVSGTEYVNESSFKSKILEYGAIYTTFYSNKEKDPDSYNSETGAWYSLTEKIDHSIAIVGWDDNYSRNNFNSNRIPPGDGAWLIKNSWGTSRGEFGYQWISYYDVSLNCKDDANIVNSVKPLSKNEYMLAYDFCPTILYHNLSTSSVNPSVYYSNVYDVSDLKSVYGYIDKVQFYNRNIGDTYSVYIAPVQNGNLPSITGLGEPLATGTIDFDGYMTAVLTQQYALNENFDKYAIIIKITTEDSSVSLSREAEYSNGRWDISIKQGESYYYNNNSNLWVDVSEAFASNGNYSIRPTLVRRTSITQDSTLEFNQVRYAGEDITVDLNLNGNLLYSIKNNGNITLYEDTEFTRTQTSVTFKKSFLETLSTTQATNIVFEFTDGAPQSLSILPKATLSSVSVTGKMAKGQTLTANALTNDNISVADGSVTYQWQSSTDGTVWTDVSGATTMTYSLTSDDVGKYYRVIVTAVEDNALQYPATLTSSATSIPIIVYGDADSSGSVSITDVSAVQKYIAGRITLTDAQLYAADVNGDGNVNILDSSLIQEYTSLMRSSFPVEEN